MHLLKQQGQGEKAQKSEAGVTACDVSHWPLQTCPPPPFQVALWWRFMCWAPWMGSFASCLPAESDHREAKVRVQAGGWDGEGNPCVQLPSWNFTAR